MSVPVIHQTDLFHPYEDPDDHWDLACQFAMCYSGDIDLRVVLIDHPSSSLQGDPSIQAVNQMSYITGVTVPVAVGSSDPVFGDRRPAITEAQRPASRTDCICSILASSLTPVTIHVSGSCRDVALAGVSRPELFAEKCKAIYLNAGASHRDSVPEYNVRLDPEAFASIFSIPCPVYWMPCFTYAPETPGKRFETSEYGTYYRFLQGDVLSGLSVRMQRFFVYSLGRVTDSRWLSYLSLSTNDAILTQIKTQHRNMWCTAGFIHAAGKTVACDGSIVEKDKGSTEPVFSFEPVEVESVDSGRVSWKRSTKRSPDTYIFRVLDLDLYSVAMTTALKSLLHELP